MEKPKQAAARYVDHRAVRDMRRAREQAQRRHVGAASVLVGFFQLMIEAGDNARRKIVPLGTSKRSALEIRRAVNAFYNARPRPWRPAHCASKAMRAPKVRYGRYRRSQAKAA